jgi:hypothetical protein
MSASTMSFKDNLEVIGASSEDGTTLKNEEARKRGTASPAGFFALLGELDYYRLIENLIRGPVTDQQLITPYRWWLFFKGSALSSVAGVVVLMTRVCLLIPGETLPFWFKYSTFLGIFALLLFVHGSVFMQYANYPNGATWVAVKYALAGFSVGVLSSEFLKTLVVCASIFFREYVALSFYGKFKITDILLEMYYDRLVGSYAEELVTFLVSIITITYFWLYFNKRTQYRTEVLETGKPYDLST